MPRSGSRHHGSARMFEKYSSLFISHDGFAFGVRLPQAIQLLITTEARSLRPDVVSFSTAISSCERAAVWQHSLLLGENVGTCWHFVVPELRNF